MKLQSCFNLLSGSLLACMLLAAPTIGHAQQQREKLQVAQTAMLPLTDFKGIDVQLPVEVKVRQAKEYQVKIESDYAHLIDDISIEVQSNRLIITGTDAIKEEMNNLKKFPIMRFELLVPTLEYVSLAGSSELEIEKSLSTQSFELISKGEGKVKIDDLNAEKEVIIRLLGKSDIKMRAVKGATLDAELTGEGDLETKDITLSGGFKSTLSGKGELETGSVEATSVNVSINGEGKAKIKEIEKSNQVAITADGNGKVSLGDVETKQFTINSNGTGDVEFKSLKADNVTLQALGKGEINAKSDGKAERCTINVQGKGDVDVKRLEAKFVDVKIDGKGEVSVFASSELNVDSGKNKAKVKYRGAPRAIVAPNSRAALIPIK